jgi:hypothetical protein
MATGAHQGRGAAAGGELRQAARVAAAARYLEQLSFRFRFPLACELLRLGDLRRGSFCLVCRCCGPSFTSIWPRRNTTPRAK